MRNRAIILFVFAMSILIGCLGTGGGSGSSSSIPGTLISTAAISGSVYLQSTSLYGGIAIQAKDINGVVVGNAVTDSFGNFYFNELDSGVYSLYATTGESEVNFISGVQVIPAVPVKVPEKALIELSSVNLDRITSTSVRIKFNSPVECISQVEFNPAGGNTSLQTVSSSYVKNHQTTITGLTPTTRYNFIVKLQSQNGQFFIYSSLSATTLSAIGPSNLALNIEDGAISTKFTSVQLNFAASDASQMRVGNTENLEDEPWVAYTSVTTYNLPAGDGTKRVYAQFRDAFGNITSVINDSILLQSNISGHIGVWINNGEAITNDVNVLLSFLYPGATQMMVSDSPDFINSFWEIFTNSRKFKFSTGDGPKTIYVKFKGGNADQYKVFTGVIQLDTTGPEVLMAINAGALKTNSINVTVSFTPIQIPARMKVSMDESFADQTQWLPFVSEYNFLLSKTDGDKTVYAKFEDELGNPFGPISAQIELDTAPPDATEFSINEDADETNSLNVTLRISANDATYIMISNDENFTGVVPERYKTIKTWVLGGYGVQSIFMSFIDDASNTSTILTKSIIVNGTAPSSSSVAINENDPTSESATNSLTIFSADAVSIRISTNQNFGTLADIPFVPNLANGAMRIENFPLSREAGEKFAYVRFLNASGTYSISSDSITLIGPASYSLSTFEEQPLSTYTVKLRPFAIKATEMLITENYTQLSNAALWRNFVSEYNFLLTKDNGKHTVYYKYRNAGYIETKPLSIDLIVSKVSPATPAILINNGDSSTTNSNVTIKTLADTKYQIVRLANTNAFESEINQSAGNLPWVLDQTAGEQTVYARFQHSDTGEFAFASDKINAIGPASPTISTNETSPLDKNWLVLNLYAGNAREMIVTEDPGIANITSGWIPYQTRLVFPLASSTGAHTIYAKFRSSAINYIETVPVKLVVTVDSEAPSGNSAAFRATADPTSDELFRITPASMPIFLHFDVADSNTATITWQIAPAGSFPTSAYTESTAPLAPVLLDSGDFTGNGTFNLYYKFSDGAGNETSLGIKSITLAGAPPSDNTVAINEGDPTAESATATIILYSATAQNIRISTDQNFGVVPDIPFVQNYMTDTMELSNYVFSREAGEKILYVRFQDASGTYSVSSDTITLVGPTNQALTTTENQPLTTYTVNLRPFAINASEMLITENYAELGSSTLWQAFSYSHNFQLTIENGVHTVYAKYRNNGKVETAPLSIDLTVSEIPPATPAIMINNGDALTYSSNTQIKVITTNKYPIVRISNDGIFNTVADTAAVNQPWFIDHVAGVKTVYSRFQHSDTGDFVYAKDTITAIGPASPSISTNDSMPLNKNWVALKLYAGQATDMIVTEDPGIADLTVGWQSYQTSFVFPLASSTGDHTVYVKYRNAASANYIETVPVQLTVTVNSVSPSGNTATFRETAAPSSVEVAEVAVGSLPVFLHLNITDVNTATISYAIVSSGNSAPTVYTKVSPPVAPIQLGKSDFSGNGTFNLYYKFADGIGNETPVNVKSIKINGPMLTISPANTPAFKSGQNQQFIATLENISGGVTWQLSPTGPVLTCGSIDSSTGLYTAPNLVRKNATATITATSNDDNTASDTTTITLESEVEVISPQDNISISINKTATMTITFVNSYLGGNIRPVLNGSASFITPPASGTPGTDATAILQFDAPAAVPSNNPVEVVIESDQDESKRKTIFFTIRDHDFVNVTPTNASVQLRTGSLPIIAQTSDNNLNVTWTIPNNAGSLSATTIATTVVTPYPYSITYYAPATSTYPIPNPVLLIASITDTIDDYTATVTILLTSTVKVKNTPQRTSVNAGNIDGITVKANVDYATTTEVIWEFRNSINATETTTAWILAGDTPPPSQPIGRLETSGSNVIYYPPNELDPTLIGHPNPPIWVRATSIDDYQASFSTKINLDKPIKVSLYKGFGAVPINLIATSGDALEIATITPVTLEVGQQQFFAEVETTETGINNTFKWTIEGAEGTTPYGEIDSTGRFTAPDSTSQNRITLRATSNEYPQIYAECYIELNNFWMPWSEGLTNDTGAIDSVYSVMLDPTTATIDDKHIYCGTNGNGVYEITNLPSDMFAPPAVAKAASYPWNTTSLSTTGIGMSPKFIINNLSISLQNQRVVAATSDGAHIISPPNPSSFTERLAGDIPAYVKSFTNVISAIAIDPTDEEFLYVAGKNQGITRYIWDGASNYTYDGTLYDDVEPMDYIYYKSGIWTDDATNPNHTFQYPQKGTQPTGSSTMTFTTVVVDPQNPNTLYAGFINHWVSHEAGVDVFRNGYIKFSSAKTDNFLTSVAFAVQLQGDLGPASGPILTVEPPASGDGIAIGNIYDGSEITLNNFKTNGVRMTYNYSTGIILSMAIDPNTPTTMWIGKNDGIYRSTDSGTTWASLGGYANVRSIFIDPINTVNVYIGTETGLYVTKDAGANWKQIKTGLEAHTTINSLSLSPGGIGLRRIFCGTTGGVFMGRTSLDLE